jgi:glycosyltransferase involved in cell wall biosynthesis
VRPHLVHLTTQWPDPRGGGGAVRQFHLLRGAASAFEVTVLAGEGAGPPSPESLAPIQDFATVVSLSPRAWGRSWPRRVARLAAIAGSPRPYTASRYDPMREPAALALARLPRAPDILHVEPSNAAGWLALAPAGCARVLGFHDVLFEVEREAARLAGVSPARLLHAVEWRKLRGYERRAAGWADLCVMASESDATRLRRGAPGARTTVVPNGVDSARFRPAAAAEEEDDLIVFTGSMNHPPNKRAAVRLAEDILPGVRAERPGARLRIVGRAPGPTVLALDGRPGVEVVGEVPDTRPYLARAAVVVAPIEFGGGSRLKVLEAMAMGKAVVATPKGAEGLDVRDGEHLVVASLGEFPGEVAALLADSGRRRELGVAGRRLVERRYDWSALGARFAASLSDPARP